ncbi:MAG: copper chaperone PCu(A)C [Gammaproteobacteria bacterium]|nr:copper chaperone PCu(A)C [Gammaproteobacteria bacterium]NKB63947.1 copper chaperone PCu(A)C [Gammaproteobacteria bacterium]
MKKVIFSGLVLLFVAIVTYAFYFKPTTMMLHHGWTRVAPPNSPMAGYFELHNHSDSDYSLIGASSSDFDHVMIHRSFEEGGVVKMAHIDEVKIKQGGNISFKPGGFHLMLMGRKREFERGDKISMALHFKSNSEMKVELEVKSTDESKHDHSSH